ncbi:MAG: hypothetical protein AB7O21_16195 [Gammaproteobacteria bacterium]
MKNSDATPRCRTTLTSVVLALAASLGPATEVTAASMRGNAEAAAGFLTLIGTTTSLLDGETFAGTARASDAPRTASHFFQRTLPSEVEPVLGLMSSATVTSQFGRISAFAIAESTGSRILPASPFNNGASAAAGATLFDTFRVRSDSLAAGTPVDLVFDLVVGGNGRFDSSYLVEQRATFNGGPLGIPKGISLSLSGGFDGIGGTTSGVIHALVGERYAIEYSLRVDATVSTSGQTEGTRFAVSDYANTGHFYVQATDGAVFLDVESGHDYTPAPVPLPAGGWLLLSGLILTCRPRHGRRQALWRVAPT